MTETLQSPQLALLQSFVGASGWHANPTGLRESTPHMAETLSPDDQIQTLRNLGLPLTFARARLNRLDMSDCPALFLADQGYGLIIHKRQGDKILVEGATHRTPTWTAIPDHEGLFVQIAADADEAETPPASVQEIGGKFAPVIGALLLASLFVNAMALAVPFLIMAIYDRVIPTQDTGFLTALIVATGVIVATDFALRGIRARAIAHMGAVMEGRLSLALFRKLAAMPLSELKKNDVDQQISRLKQFENMRELFSGAAFTALLDLPFILIFLGILFWYSTAVGILILCAVGVFAVAGKLTALRLARLNAASGAARNAHQKFVLETLSSQREIARHGLQSVWQERYDVLARQMSDTARKARQFQMVSQSFSQSVMALSGIGAIVLGTTQAMTGDLSFGGLIVIMALVWKVLSPVVALISSAPQIENFRKSRNQIDRVLALGEEFTRQGALADIKSFDGSLSLAGVSHRFAAEEEFRISQISLEVSAGDCVLICGPNGSGKSVLLDIIARLHVPTTGLLQLDGANYRQIAVEDFQQAISYARQSPDFFHGTVFQNLQLAWPTLTRDAARKAIADMQLEDELEHLPDGMDTRLSEQVRKTLSAAVASGISLARCFARPAAIYLLDDPTNGLDSARLWAFEKTLSRLKGQHTILMTGHAPEQIRQADHFIYLDKGRVLLNDSGPDGRRKLQALIDKDKGDSHGH